MGDVGATRPRRAIDRVARLTIVAIGVGGLGGWGGRLVAQPPGGGPRTVAVTIDDLPKVGGSSDLPAAAYVTRAILAALRRHDAPAVGFVTTDRVLVLGQIDARVDLLRQWVTAGMTLGNHTVHHPPFHDTPFLRYLDDVVQGALVPERLMREQGDSLRYFRHPFNSAGPTPGLLHRFRDAMASRGQVIAQFTVEHADYVFERVYTHAHAAGDHDLRDEVSAAYLRHLDTAFAVAEALSRDTFGRPIAHVLLIHANELNAALLDAMLTRLKDRGYTFVSLDDARQDPAYRTPEAYAGRWGISWLHRWRMALGLPSRLREEPDPPAWIMERYAALSREP